MKKYPSTPLPAARRKAFTLVEILIVVGILIMLLAMSTPIVGFVSEAQNRARAKADMEVMASALESFKARYQSYPRFNAGANPESVAESIYKCLSGKMYLKVENGQISFVESQTDGKPFVDVTKLNLVDSADRDNTNVDPERTGIYIGDPWRNPYLYFYDTSMVAGSHGSWRNPGFLLMCTGPDGIAADVQSMYSTGFMPDEDDYRTPDENVDNIIQGMDD